MQKPCSRCQVTKPLSDFALRSLSKDGRAAKCHECRRIDQQIKYWLDSADREATIARVRENKVARFEREPGYKRAFNLWGSTKRRKTKIPPWVAITDFIPICKLALKKGADYEIDHVIPLNHPLVCGLHVPKNLRVVLRKTNLKKRNHFVVA